MAAAAAAPPVRGYCRPAAAASTSSVALCPAPGRVRIPAAAAFLSAPRWRGSVRLRAAAAAEAVAVPDAPRGLQLRREEEWEVEEELDKVGEEKVEGWMRESIAEIVRHIGEAPFLVHLFNDDDEQRVTVRREAATAEAWPEVRRRWGAGGRERRPDGIILVERLAAAVEDGASAAGAGAGEAARQVWGLVVQARGMDCASCYVLDTCRVRSPAGLCTHFCLARAQCFGDSLELQLRNAWLNRLSSRR